MWWNSQSISSSLWVTQTSSPSDHQQPPSPHAKSPQSPFLPHSDVQFGLQRLIFDTSACLNVLSCCHVIGCLDICRQLYILPNDVAGECTACLKRGCLALWDAGLQRILPSKNLMDLDSAGLPGLWTQAKPFFFIKDKKRSTAMFPSRIHDQVTFSVHIHKCQGVRPFQ